MYLLCTLVGVPQCVVWLTGPLLMCASASAGKLKDLGNSLLGKFGMSLDNFKAEQDPATGGYSIKFVQ
jgi:hypothetical protein